MKPKFNKAISTGVLLTSWFLIFICTLPSNAQVLSSDEDGVKTTYKGNLEINYDEFTGEIGILVADTLKLSNFYEVESGDQKSFVMPMFGGKESNLKDSNEADNLFGLTAFNMGYNKFLSEEMGNIPVLYLIDGKRNATKALYFSSEEEESNIEMLIIKFSEREWEQIIKSEETKFRINNNVLQVDKNTKSLMAEVFKEYKAIKSDFNKRDNAKETKIPDKDVTNGIKVSEKEVSTPYELRWEGDIERNPMVLPLPDNVTDSEATITIRFEVKPDGSIGRIIPLKQMNPELEREVMSTLRSWRFSRLPSGIPQQSQWGTITFQFVLE
jgi:TonB family protein